MRFVGRCGQHRTAAVCKGLQQGSRRGGGRGYLHGPGGAGGAQSGRHRATEARGGQVREHGPARWVSSVVNTPFPPKLLDSRAVVLPGLFFLRPNPWLRYSCAHSNSPVHTSFGSRKVGEWCYRSLTFTEKPKFQTKSWQSFLNM